MAKTKQRPRKKPARKCNKCNTIRKGAKKKVDKTEERIKEKRRLFLELFPASAGSISKTCEKIGISRVTFYRWRETDKSFDRKFREAEESLIDWVETRLMKCIDQGNVTAIIFFLTNKGKGRGWKNQYQLTHEGGDAHKPVRVVVQGVDLSNYPKAQETADSKQ